MNNIDIEKIINIDYITEVRNKRRGNGIYSKRISKNKSQEFFTPWVIVEKLMSYVSEEDWRDPTKTFLDTSGGNGNILLGIIWKRITSGIDWKTTLETTFSVELMQDNVYETHGRIIKLFDALGIDYDEDIAMDIMLKNLVCSDFFTWNFEEWRPYTDEELKKLKIKK